MRNRDRSSSISKSGCASSVPCSHQATTLRRRSTISQPLGGVHPLPRRRSCLSVEQCGGTSLARCSGGKKELDLRRFRCWWPSRRRRLHPRRNMQDERCRPASLACRRAGPASRLSRQQSRRPAALELEGEPGAQGRRGCLSDPQRKIAYPGCWPGAYKSPAASPSSSCYIRQSLNVSAAAFFCELAIRLEPRRLSMPADEIIHRNKHDLASQRG